MKYAEYKDSSVDWIGEVPIHWKIMRGKFIVKVLPGYAFDSKKFTSDEGISLIRIRDINNTSTEMNYSGSFNEEYIVNTGDVLVGMDGDFNVAKWKGERALLNQRVCKIVGTNIMLSSYMYYLLSRPLKLINDVCYATTVKHLSTSDIENSLFPVPTIQEQHAIVADLNEKCNKIDGAIDVQKKKIDLLNELKQSIITEVVTKGLKPDAPMKDSGVEWIGKIPTQWKRSRLKFLFSHSNAGVWGEEEKGDENDIACFRVADFDYQKGYLGFDKLTMRNITAKELDGRLLTEGSLLIEKSGGGDATPVGRVVRFNYEDKATCSNFVHFVTVDESHNSDFLYYYFYAMYANKENLLYFNQTTGIQNLKVGEYLGQSIFIPTYEEQQAIASYLDEKCGKINDAIDVQKKKIDLLNELKQSIITEAVTGKIKVC